MIREWGHKISGWVIYRIQIKTNIVKKVSGLKFLSYQ